MAPSCLPVCERHAAASSLAAAVLAVVVSVCSFPNTWFTMEHPADTSHSPGHTGLSCSSKGALLSVLIILPFPSIPSPGEVDALTSWLSR